MMSLFWKSKVKIGQTTHLIILGKELKNKKMKTFKLSDFFVKLYALFTIK